MNHPDEKQTMFLLQKWAAMHDGLERLMGNAEAVFGALVDSPFFETSWKNFDTYTDTLAQLIGDQGDWMTWFYSENAMGAKGLEAGYDKRDQPIKTLAHLAALILESRQREGQQ
jgi:hypothetical protein